MTKHSGLSRKFSLKFFRVVWEADDSDPQLVPRLNRQLSKATERNRIKRVLREFFRHYGHKFDRGRWVFIAKTRVEKVPNKEVFHDLETILSQFSDNRA